ncbi:MAG: VWA domain-containing protein, partial [Flavobacteriales bacterium]|nr:VWA domain-containing protein [Flavobacteriales bacterium]
TDDLGIGVNDQWEEAETTTSVDSRWDEPEDISEERNQTLEQEPLEFIEPELSRVENVPLETVDLGISTNDHWEEEAVKSEELIVKSAELQDEDVNRQPTIANQQSVEEQVESALAKSETPSTSNSQLPTEPEPEFSVERYRPNNVLLLLDVSGSMKEDGKMTQLKSSIRRMIMMLRNVDVLTMIAYNSSSWEVLPPTFVKDNRSMVELVDSLQPYGYTNGVKGMEAAYESLHSQLIKGGNNQLIIATDGKFNSSNFSERDAVQLVKANSDKGIVLSIIGFGEDKEATKLMRKLAKEGNGSFLQINKNEDPTELLAEEIKQRSQKI